MLDTKTMGPRALAFILSEGNGMISREAVTIASGAGKVDPGTVLGRIALGAATAAANDGNTGNGTISAVTTGDGAKDGAYQVVFTAATKFDVFDPDGFAISKGSTGAAFADDIGFTITAGGTAFVAGDGFEITIAKGSGKWVPSPATESDGSQVARAILAYGVDATDEDVEAVIVDGTGGTEVKEPLLIFHSSVDDSDKRNAKLEQLRAVGIKAR
jgi:hypothetical protein